MKKTVHFLTGLLLILLAACSGETSKDNSASGNVSVVEKDTLRTIPIFYQIMMPLEMTQVFEKAGIKFSKDILNPVDKADDYTLSSKVAMNLGVYGVDLGYVKIFGDAQLALKYFGSIHKLAMQLGIPENYLTNTMDQFEKNIGNRDSLTRFASEVYQKTDEYLKKAERPEASSFIILGGWIESLYIASISWQQDNPNEILARRIASQKYSLNSLINLLSNYAGDQNVSQYLLMLKILKKSFDKITIYYPQGKVDVDTINKVIMSDDYHIQASDDTMREITTLIISMRREIID